MRRYIDIDKAIPIAIQKAVDVVGHGITQFDAVDIATAIEEASTADVVEVVRCKDCKYIETVTWPITGTKTTFCTYGIKPMAVTDEFYCGNGERKD